MTTAVEVGRRIREARRAAGMTQGDLARRLGMRQGPVSNIERGHCLPHAATLVQISAALHCTTDELLTGGSSLSAVVALLRAELAEARAERDAARTELADVVGKLRRIKEACE